MASSFQLILCLGMLAVCLANPVNNIRWCVRSEIELKKCRDVSATCVNEHVTLSCVLKASSDDCFKAIADDLADAISLDSGEIYRASLNPYNLKPVAAENYGTEKDPDTCYYSVALVKKSSNFMFKDLQGKRTCHTAVGRAAGWTSPVGTLLALGLFTWDGPEDKSIERALSEFVSAGCAPGSKEPTLCKQCKGKGDKKCKASNIEAYFGYAGAYLCLKEDAGDVSFVKHILPAECKKDYELLCPDNTRKSIEEYEKCSLGRIPAHAVVTVDKSDKIKAITQFLADAQKKAECKLFSSPHGKDLMFKDSATSLIPLPEKTDAFLYLGSSFTNANKALTQKMETPSEDVIRWCTQNKEEEAKCDRWSIASEGKIECVLANSAEDCITKVLKGEADAVTLDGGYLYTAGACGLVPAMQEIYNADTCKQKKITKKGTYFAVAVVKKSNKDITWKKLRGAKSCHTGLGRTAGYNVPVGLIHKDTGICDLATFFSASCIPGADVNSNLCQLCAGNDKAKCQPNTKEPYYSYQGAFRCLIERGDIALVKDTTVIENLESANPPAWAKGYTKDDFELLCLDGSRKPITEAKSCHLAEVPAHGVATTAARKDAVISVIKAQQELYGSDANPDAQFKMFVSEGKKDQLFKDSTKCVREVEEKTMDEFLGKEYTEAIKNLNECGKSGLLAACTFHTCKLQ